MTTRDSIMKAARARGETVDEFLTELLEEQSWRERMSTARAAMARPDTRDLEETAAWDSLEMLQSPGSNREAWSGSSSIQ